MKKQTPFSEHTPFVKALMLLTRMLDARSMETIQEHAVEMNVNIDESIQIIVNPEVGQPLQFTIWGKDGFPVDSLMRICNKNGSFQNDETTGIPRAKVQKTWSWSGNQDIVNMLNFMEACGCETGLIQREKDDETSFNGEGIDYKLIIIKK